MTKARLLKLAALAVIALVIAAAIPLPAAALTVTWSGSGFTVERVVRILELNITDSGVYIANATGIYLNYSKTVTYTFTSLPQNNTDWIIYFKQGANYLTAPQYGITWETILDANGEPWLHMEVVNACKVNLYSTEIFNPPLYLRAEIRSIGGGGTTYAHIVRCGITRAYLEYMWGPWIKTYAKRFVTSAGTVSFAPLVNGTWDEYAVVEIVADSNGTRLYINGTLVASNGTITGPCKIWLSVDSAYDGMVAGLYVKSIEVKEFKVVVEGAYEAALLSGSTVLARNITSGSEVMLLPSTVWSTAMLKVSLDNTTITVPEGMSAYIYDNGTLVKTVQGPATVDVFDLLSAGVHNIKVTYSPVILFENALAYNDVNVTVEGSTLTIERSVASIDAPITYKILIPLGAVPEKLEILDYYNNWNTITDFTIEPLLGSSYCYLEATSLVVPKYVKLTLSIPQLIMINDLGTDETGTKRLFEVKTLVPANVSLDIIDSSTGSAVYNVIIPAENFTFPSNMTNATLQASVITAWNGPLGSIYWSDWLSAAFDAGFGYAIIDNENFTMNKNGLWVCDGNTGNITIKGPAIIDVLFKKYDTTNDVYYYHEETIMLGPSDEVTIVQDLSGSGNGVAVKIMPNIGSTTLSIDLALLPPAYEVYAEIVDAARCWLYSLKLASMNKPLVEGTVSYWDGFKMVATITSPTINTAGWDILAVFDANGKPLQYTIDGPNITLAGGYTGEITLYVAKKPVAPPSLLNITDLNGNPVSSVVYGGQYLVKVSVTARENITGIVVYAVYDESNALLTMSTQTINLAAGSSKELAFLFEPMWYGDYKVKVFVLSAWPKDGGKMLCIPLVYTIHVT